jgi:hypothetical protein
MAYLKKTWVDRQTEHPTRRKLTSTGTADVYDVSREEGLVVAEGDALNATNLNDLEARIDDGIRERATVSINTTKTLSNASWSGASAPYTQAVTVTGLLAADTPLWDVVSSATPETALAEWEYASQMRTVAAANTLTFYYMGDDAPDIDIDIHVEVIR